MNKSRYDIVITGGGLAGSLMAISIKRKNPAISILIIERSAEFFPKAGESSAEITGLFFNRFQIPHILKKQLPKAGLRFVFNESQTADFSKADEFSSPSVRSIANGYHFNRKEFDQDLLIEAEKSEAEILRPAEIISFQFEKFNSKLKVRYGENESEISAVWVIDASGTERIAGKAMNWCDTNLQFDTAACLAHFTGLRPQTEWDNTPNPFWDKYAIGPRSESTIHFLREGCWWWHIRLNDQTTSIGIVYDKTIHQPEDPVKFFEDFLTNDAQLNFITAPSSHGTVKVLPKLPYLSKKLYDEGLVVIGDAAAFVDPLFSPGIEFICQQSIWLTDLITDYFTSGNFNQRKWNRYEKLFLKAFRNRILIYQNRYKLMHSYDLFSNWVQFDFFGYYSFTIIPVVIFPRLIKYPPAFSFPLAPVYNFITGRYLKIAARRKKQNRISTSLKKPLSLSHVAIPSGLRLYFKPLQLFGIWFANYIRIVFDEWRFRFSGKK